MEHDFKILNEREIDRVARSIIPLLKKYRIAAFYGSMGVGKTTFIKGLCKVLGVPDPVSSPSFAIVNEYLTVEGEAIFHFDFYRLKYQSEVYDLGYEEYFYGENNICLIEWPEKIQEILPEPRLDIYMQTDEDEVRLMRVVERIGA